MTLLARFRPPTFIIFFFALLLGTSTGCFKRYTVIKQSGPPSALQGTTAIAVQFDTSNIAISKDRKSEQEWLDSREKDEHRANYTESREAADSKFLEGLSGRASGVTFTEGQAGPGEIQMTVSWIWWEEGLYAAVVKWPSEATARVIFTRDGETLDEIEVKSREAAEMTTADPRARFRTIGKRLGAFTADFVNSSVAAGG